jgi:two-component system, NtrC family, sensor kinase
MPLAKDNPVGWVHKVATNLHNGIDSPTLMLKYRLKANKFHPAIAIPKDYSELPLVPCFSGQLNKPS